MTPSSPDRLDEVRPNASPVAVRFVGHATTLIELGGIRVLTDPFLRSRLGPLERHGPLPDPAELDVDLVVISHGHQDHFDRRSLEGLPGRPSIVLPAGLGARLGDGFRDRVTEVRAGDSVQVGGLTVRAVPARHWISPGAARAQPIGYVIEAGQVSEGGPRAYFAGDTGPYPFMSELIGPVDLALLPVWTWGPHLGPGHLGPRTAAEVAHEIGARFVVPIHWGTLYPRHLHRVWRGPLREPGDRFATFAKQLAPEVDVRVLRPGEATTFESAPDRPPRARPAGDAGAIPA